MIMGCRVMLGAIKRAKPKGLLMIGQSLCDGWPHCFAFYSCQITRCNGGLMRLKQSASMDCTPHITLMIVIYIPRKQNTLMPSSFTILIISF